MTKIGLFFLSTTTLLSCDYFDNRLKINNLSNRSIVIETYLDTIPIISATNNTEYYLRKIIKSKQVVNFNKPGSKNSWSFQILNSKNKKLNLFVFDLDSLKKYNAIDSLINKRLYTRLEYSQKELEMTNWCVAIAQR